MLLLLFFFFQSINVLTQNKCLLIADVVAAAGWSDEHAAPPGGAGPADDCSEQSGPSGCNQPCAFGNTASHHPAAGPSSSAKPSAAGGIQACARKDNTFTVDDPQLKTVLSFSSFRAMFPLEIVSYCLEQQNETGPSRSPLTLSSPMLSPSGVLFNRCLNLITEVYKLHYLYFLINLCM